MGYNPEATFATPGGTARLSTLYSMESERVIHEQMLAGKDAAKLAGAPKAPDLGNLGNDVELF